MTYNGIDYGDLQLLSEAYDLVINVAVMSNDAMHKVFAIWNLVNLISIY